MPQWVKNPSGLALVVVRVCWCFLWGSHGTPKHQNCSTDHCRYPELSQAEIALLGLNCKIKMNWYHITVSGFSRSSQGLVLFSLQVGTPEQPGLGVPARGREWRCFKVPPKPKHSVIPWLCCLRPGVCWDFTLFLAVSLSFPGVYFGGYLNSRVRVLWSWCPVLPALPQWQELGFVWSERTDRLDFGGVCVPGLILAYSNVKLQPSVPCVPLENKMLMLSGFRGFEEKL